MHRGLDSFGISNPYSDLFSDIFLSSSGWIISGDHRISEVFVMGISFSGTCFLWLIRVTLLCPLPSLVQETQGEGADGLWQWNKAQALSNSRGKTLARLSLTYMEVISEWDQFSQLNSRKIISLGLQLELYPLLDFIQHSHWSQLYLLWYVTSLGIFSGWQFFLVDG